MGFRSVIISEDSGLVLPKWFIVKYEDRDYVFDAGRLAMASLIERKFYNKFSDTELFLDIQIVLKEQKENILGRLEFVLFHECGGITKVIVTRDSIIGLEPSSWEKVDQVSHHYCYDCSDI